MAGYGGYTVGDVSRQGYGMGLANDPSSQYDMMTGSTYGGALSNQALQDFESYYKLVKGVGSLNSQEHDRTVGNKHRELLQAQRMSYDMRRLGESGTKLRDGNVISNPFVTNNTSAYLNSRMSDIYDKTHGKTVTEQENYTKALGLSTLVNNT